MDLPVFEMVINPEPTSDIEVSFVALVDKPAIEKNFLAFKDQRIDFAINEEQRIISGPAMVANSLIYRKDDNGEYNVFFSKETIKDISIKFFKKGYERNVNLFHDPNMKMDGVTIFESFVTDVQRGIQPMKGFEDLPDGSWFISAKIDNPQVWDAIKAGQLKGFSVEGIFSYVKKKFLSAKDENNCHLGEIDFMSEVKDLWLAFKEKFLGNPPVAPQNPVQMQDLTLADGTTIQVDKLDVGGLCTVNGAPCPAGTYELADGTQVTVGDGGVISAVQMKATDPGTDYTKQFASYDEKFTSYEQKFADYEQKFQALATLQENFNKTNQMVIELMGIVSKIVETPTADPTEPKNNFQTQKQITKDEKRKELAELFAKIKRK